MTHLDPEIFGTGDARVYLPETRHLYVIDYKHGRGVVVDAEENPQLQLYGAGTVRALAAEGYLVDSVTLVIVQPRAFHKDGRVRQAHYDRLDLLEFELDIQRRAKLVHEAEDLAEEGALSEEEWRARYLCAGDHCGFCPRLGDCRTAKARALEIARASFSTNEEGRVTTTIPPINQLSQAEMAAVLNAKDFLKAWFNAVEQHANAEAQNGRVPTGYKLVPRRGRWGWTDPEAWEAYLKSTGATREQIYDIKPLKLASHSAMQRAFRKKQFEALKADFKLLEGIEPAMIKSSGYNLVPDNDPRPEILLDAATQFTDPE